jgi:hypothetical protein
MKTYKDMKNEYQQLKDSAIESGLVKDMSYYIVEVSFFNGNSIHRAICFHRSSGHVELMSAGYDDENRLHISKLKHFKVICELEEMNKKLH